MSIKFVDDDLNIFIYIINNNKFLNVKLIYFININFIQIYKSHILYLYKYIKGRKPKNGFYNHSFDYLTTCCFRFYEQNY